MVTNPLKHILTEARRGFTTKSDIARQYADEVAMAASKGWISTCVDIEEGCYCNTWHITAIGLMALEHKYYAPKK